MNRFGGSVFTLIGIIVLYLGAKSLWQANASKSWPTVSGKVVSSTVLLQHSSKGSDTYQADVLYAYTAGGQDRSSRQIAFGSFGSGDPSHARKIVSKYPAGQAVTVHYSLADPNFSVLEVGVSGQTFLLPACGVVFFVGGLAIFVYKPSMFKKWREAEGGVRSNITKP